MHKIFREHHRASAFDDSTPLPHRLPVGHSMECRAGRWNVRIPVHAEQATLGREVVVAEEVEISMRTVQDFARAHGSVRREVLDVDTQGDLEETRPVDVTELQRAEVRRARSSRTLRQLRNR